jgi:hypothetical protein
MGLDPALFPLTDETTTDLFTWARVVDDRNIQKRKKSKINCPKFEHCNGVYCGYTMQCVTL